MKVVICDDEKSICTSLENIINRFMEENKIKCETDILFSGEELGRYMKENEDIDVLFLDIQLPDRSGVEIGAAIREKLENEKIMIIYISSHTQYALSLFRNRPFDFLVKPIKETEIRLVLERVLKIMGRQNDSFSYQTEKITYRIPYKNILYFRSEGRKVIIVTVSGIKSFYGKLNLIAKQVPENVFLRIHKSYLINFDFVAEYAYEEIKMVNGEHLTVSKANRVEVRRKILSRRREADND